MPILSEVGASAIMQDIAELIETEPAAIERPRFAADIFGGSADSGAIYTAWMQEAHRVLNDSLSNRAYPGATPEQLHELLEGEICPEAPVGRPALAQRLSSIIHYSIQPFHPFAAAHLHTPVLSASLAAEAILTALNQSMDSFDQAPAASVLEQKVLHWLCGLAGFGAGSGGTFTSGGTQSNYMGLLLARDHYCAKQLIWRVRENGLPPEASRLRFLCSEVAHFSVEKSAIQLGLGTHSVVHVPCDERFRMRPDALREQIAALRSQGLLPVSVVATAGTTDFGSIDPLAEIAGIARQEKMWLHVDAAYGGALLLTDSYRGRLTGIEQADSVTIDFHKAFFQPISCSAFLVADERRFETIRVYADYLNTEDRESEGIPDLVTKSVLTTRRFDALKLWMSLQALGRKQFSMMIERLVELAETAARYINTSPDLQLINEPEFGAVVFRYRPEHMHAARINDEIPKALFAQGRAVIGHTIVRGAPCLKLTLCNPATQPEHLRELLDLIIACGRELSQSEG